MLKLPLIILAAGGHGRVVADAALAAGLWGPVGFVDNTPGLPGTNVMGLPVLAADLGQVSDPAFANAAVHVAVGDNATRRRLTENLIEKGKQLATICHPSSIISPFAKLGLGVSVMAGAVIQAGAEIDVGTIVNTGAQIDHDCRIGAYAHISPAAVLAGQVTLGAQSWIGAGAAVRNGITIGPGLVIGVGAAVVFNLEGSIGTRFVGIPAQPL